MSCGVVAGHTVRVPADVAEHWVSDSSSALAGLGWLGWAGASMPSPPPGRESIRLRQTRIGMEEVGGWGRRTSLSGSSAQLTGTVAGMPPGIYAMRGPAVTLCRLVI